MLVVNLIVQFEHAYATPYKDVRGYYHVGVGHLLSYSNGGLNYLGNPKRNTYSITEITELFHSDLKIAITNAKKQFKSFDKQDYKVKLILCDLSFNLGGAGIAKFKNFTRYINEFDYANAANELQYSNVKSKKLSPYYKQVGVRAQNHITTLQLLAQSRK